jgi:energy-coupling factor transporter ATP-binding protein EcfA2
MKLSPFSKTYEQRTVLSFSGMELQPGKIYAIIGANGSGKSTFGKILAGILPADKKGKFAEGCTVGYMPQKNYAFRMTTRANILLNGADEARASALMGGVALLLLLRDHHFSSFIFVFDLHNLFKCHILHLVSVLFLSSLYSRIIICRGFSLLKRDGACRT